MPSWRLLQWTTEVSFWKIGAAPFLARHIEARHHESLYLFFGQPAHLFLGHVFMGDEGPIEVVEVHVFPEGGRLLQAPGEPFPSVLLRSNISRTPCTPTFPMQSKISLGFPTQDRTPS